MPNGELDIHVYNQGVADDPSNYVVSSSSTFELWQACLASCSGLRPVDLPTIAYCSHTTSLDDLSHYIYFLEHSSRVDETRYGMYNLSQQVQRSASRPLVIEQDLLSDHAV